MAADIAISTEKNKIGMPAEIGLIQSGLTKIGQKIDCSSQVALPRPGNADH